MMSTSIYCLRPEVFPRAEALLQDLQKAGIPHLVTSTRRTTEEQIALWCQGRAPLEVVQVLRRHAGLPKLHESENKYTVTNADGVNAASAHQEGKAIDIAVLVEVQGEDGRKRLLPSWDYSKQAQAYRAIADLARRHGWDCGADWPPINPETGLGRDPPHHQLAAAFSSSSSLGKEPS